MMREHDSVRDLVAQFGMLAEGAETCTYLGEIFEAASGTASPERVRELVDHSIDCPVCADAWFVARELQEDPLDGAEVPPLGSPIPAPVAPSSAWLRYGSLAAVVVLAVTLGIQSVRQDSGAHDGVVIAEVPPMRGGRGEGEELISFKTSSGAVLPRDACEVRWQGPEGARYQVEVSLVGGVEMVASSGSDYRNTSFRVEPSLLVGFAARKELRWVVSVWIDDTNQWADRAVLSVYC